MWLTRITHTTNYVSCLKTCPQFKFQSKASCLANTSGRVRTPYNQYLKIVKNLSQYVHTGQIVFESILPCASTFYSSTKACLLCQDLNNLNLICNTNNLIRTFRSLEPSTISPTDFNRCFRYNEECCSFPDLLFPQAIEILLYYPIDSTILSADVRSINR